MKAIGKFISKPKEFEAFQFQGWTSAHVAWVFANTFYVPRGYEHALRKPHEKDRSTGHVLDDASPFLVLVDPDDGSLIRVDIGDWLVKNKDGNVFRVTSKTFAEQYVAKVEG